MERYLIRYMIGCKQNQFCGGILCKNLISSFARNVFCAEKREVTVKFLVQILRDFASSNPDICLKPAFFRQFHIADGVIRRIRYLLKGMPFSRDFHGFSSSYAGCRGFHPAFKISQIINDLHSISLKSGMEWERGGIEPPVPLLAVNSLPSSLEGNCH